METIAIVEDFEIIEAVEDEVDTVSFSDVKMSLISILRRWSDTNSTTTIASKWKGGSIIITPDETNFSDKEVPINTFSIKL